MLNGKGMYLWNYQAPIALIVAECKAAGLGHLLIKIADGTAEFGATYDKRALIAALRAEGIDVWGWHYIYLAYPDSEAALALRLMGDLDLTGYIIDGEKECKNKRTQATQFMLRLSHADFPIGLSSYRYPSLHPEFPWKEFRAGCDFDMPQVYWLMAHDPVAQLHKSYDEFKKMTPALPYLPTGSAWKQSDWSPTPAEITAFMDEAKKMGFTGVNFWEFNKTRAVPPLWDTIKAYPWTPAPDPEPPDDELVKRVEALERDATIYIPRIAVLEAADAEYSKWLRDLTTRLTKLEAENTAQGVRFTIGGSRANLRWYKDTDKADKPIMIIREPRVQYEPGAVIRVDPAPVIATGGERYYKVMGFSNPDLFVRAQDGVLQVG